MKAKKKLSLIDKIILWLNGLLCFALLLSYLAPVVDPKTFWLIAFFGLAYPLLLVGNIVFIVFWAIRRRWYAFVSLICIAIGYNVLANNVQMRGQEGWSNAGNQTVISMMTYNVHNFKRYGSANDISTKRDILQLISDGQPDVIGFQE